jgi:hypothetical protein
MKQLPGHHWNREGKFWIVADMQEDRAQLAGLVRQERCALQETATFHAVMHLTRTAYNFCSNQDSATCRCIWARQGGNISVRPRPTRLRAMEDQCQR